jgi:hypothetical protein
LFDGNACRLRKPAQEAGCRTGIEEDAATVLAQVGASAARAGHAVLAVYRNAVGADELEHRVEEGDFDGLAAAGVFAGDQGHDDGGGGVEAAEVRRQRQGGKDRAVGIVNAGVVGAKELANGGVGVSGGAYDAFPRRYVSSGIVRGEAWDRTMNQLGVLFGHPQGAQTKTVHDAWPEVLDGHIGGCDQLSGDVVVAWLLQVQGDALFAAVVERIGVTPPPGSTWWVDVDDFGALVGQHDRRQRPCDVLAKVNNPDAI